MTVSWLPGSRIQPSRGSCVRKKRCNDMHNYVQVCRFRERLVSQKLPTAVNAAAAPAVPTMFGDFFFLKISFSCALTTTKLISKRKLTAYNYCFLLDHPVAVGQQSSAELQNESHTATSPALKQWTLGNLDCTQLRRKHGDSGSTRQLSCCCGRIQQPISWPSAPAAPQTATAAAPPARGRRRPGPGARRRRSPAAAPRLRAGGPPAWRRRSGSTPAPLPRC